MVDDEAHWDRTEQFKPEGSESGEDKLPVESVGKYRLIQRVGVGGMGEVFEAEQQAPIRRRVAFKIIKKGMDTEEVVARFESERQALALMDHRAIAKVYDAGAMPDGRPFFVMEFIKGITMIEYCDANNLSNRERLALFIQVCEGVQHAHQKGIIHRDIKPTNVLVSIEGDNPVPKIIDFGLAKATGHSLTENTLYTELGQLVGTPEYMSPEQAEMSGLDVDTRTDIYSLGALLYELLVGLQPFDSKTLRQSGFDEIRRKIREDEPPKPSVRVRSGAESSLRAKSRRANPETLGKALEGDLDWICLKAMEKDRTRRYASATELVADINRHLNDQPVLAGAPGAKYRMKKFYLRHKVGVAAAGLVLLAVILGITGTTIGLIRATRAYRLASEEAESTRQVSDFLVGLFEVVDPNEARGNSVTAREILDVGVGRIRETLQDRPMIRADLMHTMGRVYTSLGLLDEAGSLLEQTVKLRQTLGDSDRQDEAESLADLGYVYSNLARFAAAESVLVKALEIQEKELGPDHLQVGETLSSLATVRRRQGSHRQAEELYRRVLRIREAELGKRHADVAETYNDLATLYYVEGKYSEAIPLYELSLEIWEETLGANHPDLARGLNNLALAYQGQRNYAKAVVLYQRALEIHEKVLGSEHPRYAANLHNLARAYYQQKDYEAARPLFEESLAIKERINGPDHPSVARTASTLAHLYKDQQNYAMAETYYRRALRIREKSLGPDHVDVAWSLANLGILFREKREFTRAEPLFEQALAIFIAATGEDSFGAAWTFSDLGILSRERGELDVAERFFQRAISSFESSLGPNHVDLAECLDNYATLLESMGRDREADSIKNRADGIRRSKTDTDT